MLKTGWTLVITLALLTMLVGGATAQTPATPGAASGTAPGNAPAASPAPGVRTRIFGRVADIDKDGDVKIYTQSGNFHIRVSPDAVRTLKDGDTATIDVVITPPTPPVR
jgi:hypothetical protein